MYYLLDVDGCVYDAYNADKTFTPYRTQARKADEDWAVKVTGKPLEELRSYRKTNAPIVGMDQSLLDFISLHTGKTYGVAELAEHRLGPNGYQPEEILSVHEELVACMRELKAQGHTFVIVSDNPIAKRTIRQVGIDETIIPDELVYDVVRMGKFKDQDFFERVLKDLKINPTDAVALGDSFRADIKPAEAAGIKAYFVEGPKALAACLKSDAAERI